MISSSIQSSPSNLLPFFFGNSPISFLHSHRRETTSKKLSFSLLVSITGGWLWRLPSLSLSLSLIHFFTFLSHLSASLLFRAKLLQQSSHPQTHWKDKERENVHMSERDGLLGHVFIYFVFVCFFVCFFLFNSVSSLFFHS